MTLAGIALAASSTAGSGMPSAWKFWTASIIVRTLPASTPSGPLTTLPRISTVEAGQAVHAVLHPRSRDRVGHERDATDRALE